MQKRKKWKKKKKVCIALFTGVIFSGIVWTSRQHVFTLVKSAGETLVEQSIFQIMYESVGNKKYYSKEMLKNSSFDIERLTGNEEKMQMHYKQKWSAEDKETLKRMEEENRKVVEATNDFVTKKKGDITKKTKNKKKQGNTNTLVEQLKASLDTEFLLENFYIVDSTTSVDKKKFDVEQMLKKDFSIKKQKRPQILIYHTHGATEQFADGKTEEDSIIGAGSTLASVLKKEYGYEVLHDKTKYDSLGGKVDRNKAYNNALNGVSEILEKNASIEVVIDLHRDGVNSNLRRVAKINGENVAQFMIFNGLCRNSKGEISYLKNPYLEDNLAFGLQLKIEAMERYPDLTIKNYLKAYRYNLHLRQRSLLIELGNENTTTEEAKKAMPYLAELVDSVLTNERK